MLAEIDYLKPYWDTVPEERAFLRRLLAEGRCELVGGTYNEPNTNLTGAESTIRNVVYGIGCQRDVLGGDPADRLAARRVRARPAVPRADGRRRADRRRPGPAARSTSGGRCRPTAGTATPA